MNSIIDLINAARRSNLQYAKLTVGEYTFSARVQSGKTLLFVNAKRRSRKYAESFLKSLRPSWA